ncbi:RNA 2',3'-cyclic phosphodiesterase [Evansella cellulosilytica]|uniref:RNA 2',3'-cyclic phosphodiesterase n=1 Tax=Evansella cellulosilytica (strain ATCC 21833 / DSM 2522 / FERM P-1141 / JCM 9156 / N-4) TaxID=649639 RepID=E6U195_EVAC2|nr:RNA 2',3'-cyclic phosphodiesterase [Evansella cellulosilytica]ADU31541.1 2'-5' RNA ligase [Evansella cellulosilytica DSM 2522]
MNNKHHFIGVKVSDKVSQVLIGKQEELDVSHYFKKVVSKEDFHLTLLFLGGWEKTHTLWERLKMTLTQRTFSLTLNSIGYFGKEAEPRVIWGGVAQSDALFNLHKNIICLAQESGFPLEKRPFKPHITIAKSLKASSFNQSLYLEQEVSWDVDTLHLFEVNPGKRPMYTSVSKIELSR